MASLGPYLREHRERRGLSVEEMARATRVAGRFLEALEAEDFGVLPAPVFTKGFIRAYCQAIGVDAEEALTRYHEQTGAPVAAATPLATVPEHAVPAVARSRGTVLVSFVLLVVLGLALFAVTLVLQSGREDRRARPVAPDSEPTTSATAPAAPTTPLSAAPREPAMTSTTPPAPTPAPAVPGVPGQPLPGERSRPAPPPATVTPPASRPTLAPVAPPASTPSAVAPSIATPPAAVAPRPSAPATPPQTAATPAAPSQIAAAVGAVTSPYRLVARASEPTWIRVRMHDGRSTEETIPAGEIREWVSNGPFVLTVGNAGGITLELNGRALPSLGGRGAVISRIVIPPAQQ